MKKSIFGIFLFSFSFILAGCFGDNGDDHVHNYVLDHIYQHPTCEDPGEAEYRCECGASQTGPYGEPLGHDIVRVEAKEATCEEIGWEAYEKCNDCDYSTYQEIPAFEHHYSNSTYEATCEEDGYTLYTCDYCGDSYKADVIEALGHDEVVYEGKEATCASSGYTSYTYCNKCHQNTSLPETIPALPHEIVIDPGTPATCSSFGWGDAQHCLNCDTATTGHEQLPVLEHNYVDNVCTLCNRPKASEGVEYEILYNSYAVVKSIVGCTDVDIVIDSNYQGYPVQGFDYGFMYGLSYDINSLSIPDSIIYTQNTIYVDNIYIENLANYAKMGNVIAKNLYVKGELVEHLVIPEGVEKINSGAFSSLECLKSVTIGEEVKTISNDAFYNCINLAEVNILGDLDYVGSSAFSGCASLETVKFNKVKEFGSAVFKGCTKMNSFEFPEGIEIADLSYFLSQTAIESIEVPSIPECKSMHYMFAECKNLSSVNLPNGMTEIYISMFDKCENLRHIDIPSSVTSIGYGAFYGTPLTEILLPKNLTRIGDQAFYGCTGLTEIIIPDSVSYIGSGAFYGCAGIKKITIPSNVTEIQEETFLGCITLHTVEFGTGVKTIGSKAFYGCLSLKVITIPANVKNIGSEAFKLASLESVTMFGNWNVSVNGQATRIVVTDPATNAKYLTETYLGSWWR